MDKLQPSIFMMICLSMMIQPCFAGGQDVVIGTVFSQTRDNLALYHEALVNAVERENQVSETRQVTLRREDYDGSCLDKEEKVRPLLDRADVILTDEGCTSKVSDVLKGTGLEHHHLMVTFIPPTIPIDRPWLKIVLPEERPLTRSVTLQLVDEQNIADEEFQDNLIGQIDFPTSAQAFNRATIRIPPGKFASLRSSPQKPGVSPEPMSEVTKLEAGAKVELGDTNFPGTTTDYCRKPGTKKVYGWIYTKDWTCVKVVESDNSDNKGKTGWIHSLLLVPES